MDKEGTAARESAVAGTNRQKDTKHRDRKLRGAARTNPEKCGALQRGEKERSNNVLTLDWVG